MRGDIHYKNKSIRLADETLERLNKERKKSDKTWNLFMLDLLKHYEQRKRKDN